jgi:hypothetical protein
MRSKNSSVSEAAPVTLYDVLTIKTSGRILALLMIKRSRKESRRDE